MGCTNTLSSNVWNANAFQKCNTTLPRKSVDYSKLMEVENAVSGIIPECPINALFRKSVCVGNICVIFPKTWDVGILKVHPFLKEMQWLTSTLASTSVPKQCNAFMPLQSHYNPWNCFNLVFLAFLFTTYSISCKIHKTFALICSSWSYHRAGLADASHSIVHLLYPFIPDIRATAVYLTYFNPSAAQMAIAFAYRKNLYEINVKLIEHLCPTSDLV